MEHDIRLVVKPMVKKQTKGERQIFYRDMHDEN